MSRCETKHGRAVPPSRVRCGMWLASAVMPRQAAVEFATGGQSGAVDRSVDEDGQFGVAVLDQHVGEVRQPHQDPTALADAATRAVLVGEVYPHTRDVRT